MNEIEHIECVNIKVLTTLKLICDQIHMKQFIKRVIVYLSLLRRLVEKCDGVRRISDLAIIIIVIIRHVSNHRMINL